MRMKPILTKLELEEVSQFINQSYGLEFCQERFSLLEKAVQKRLKAHKISTGEYLCLLERQEEEALNLINLLTVHETYFFREPMHFEVITAEVIPQLIKRSRQRPFFRLLSAGCSTGEEVYSLAIAVLGMPGAGIDWDFEVVGFDVDKEAIKKAQKGSYGSYSFRTCPKNIKDSYFECVADEQFMVKSFVKEKVRFKALNLFAAVYPDRIKNMDIIFYRNVSIYFSKEQRKEIFFRLTDLLNQEGCLFLSCTETLYQNNSSMSLVKSGRMFYYRKQNIAKIVSKSAASPIPSRAPVKKHTTALPKLIDDFSNSKPALSRIDKDIRCQQIFAKALELGMKKKYEEAISCLDKLMAVDAFFVKAYTLKANILFNQQNVVAGITLCQKALVMDEFCLEAYLLLGMAAKLAKEIQEAQKRFKEAVYVYPEGWLAHFYLAEVYQLQEETSYAKREYLVAMRILQQGKFENHGLSFFAVPFTEDDFIQLCQHNLAKLKE